MSPSFGAPPAPVEWQAMQAALYTSSPERGPLLAEATALAQLLSPTMQFSPTGLIRSSIAVR
jgi:hypothetical protein